MLVSVNRVNGYLHVHLVYLAYHIRHVHHYHDVHPWRADSHVSSDHVGHNHNTLYFNFMQIQAPLALDLYKYYYCTMINFNSLRVEVDDHHDRNLPFTRTHKNHVVVKTCHVDHGTRHGLSMANLGCYHLQTDALT